MRALATFWKARCLRKAGEYDQSLEIARRAVAMASGMGLACVAAVVRTLESWLLFQKGETKEAVSILQEAEVILRDTDDFIALGNIQSSYGRIALREGRYDHAMQYFEASIDFFRRRPSLETYLARSFTISPRRSASWRCSCAAALMRNVNGNSRQPRESSASRRKIKRDS